MFFQADIEHLLQHLQPQSVFCLGSQCTAILRSQNKAGAQATCLDITEWQNIDQLGQYDLSLVLDGLESLDKGSAAHLLASLRDLHGGRFALLLNMSAADMHWQHTDLLALGLRLLQQYSVDTDSYHLYYFDLYDYKTTPDWLNSRFWANPERWNKDAW